MSRDRINELKGKNFNLNPELYDDDEGYQMAPIDDTRFVEQINNLQKLLDTGKQNIKDIKLLYSKSLTNVNQAKAQANHNALEELSSETSSIFRTIGSALKEFDNETKSMKPNKNIPIRKSQQRKLANELKTVIEEYTNIQREYKEKYYERMKRQYRIVNRNASEEEIERALEENTNQIFAQDLVTTSLTTSRNALIEAKEKHDDIKKIEQSINELCMIFQDMKTLLLTQNETIVNIEDAIDQAQVDVDQASTEMKKAIDYRKKSRKRLWIIATILLIIIIIVFIYIYATFIAPVINTTKDVVS